MDPRLAFGTRGVLLTIIALACASLSGVALVLHAVGLLPMHVLVDALGPLSLVLLLLLAVYARRTRADVFLNRLKTGAWASPLATVSYDLARLPLWASGLVTFDPFRSHPLFGTVITGLPPESPIAIVVGWGYHFWNGLGFGIMYTLVAGPARWYYAVAWALLLEAAWLATLPAVVDLQVTVEAIWVSVVGHGVYGVVLGLLSQRFIRS